MVVRDGSNCPQAERQTVKQSDNTYPGKSPFLELTISYLTTNQSQPSKEKGRGEIQPHCTIDKCLSLIFATNHTLATVQTRSRKGPNITDRRD